MAKFWQDLGFLNALDTTDKILVGKNADGSTMYTDLQTVYNKISQVYFADTKPSVIAAGSVLTNPNSLTCHIAPAGTYTLPSGNVTLTGNINFFFWDFASGWTWQSFSVQVGTSNIADGSVTNAKLGNDSVNTAKIADASVTNAKIADDSVTTAKLGNNSVNTAKIADGSVTNAKIADASVTNAKIADDSVTTAKLGNSSVNTVKIADASVTNAKIVDDSVTTAKLGNSSVNTFKIADASVTEPKISKDAKIIKNWQQTASYLRYAQVIFRGKIWEANTDTLGTDVPSSSSKWTEVLNYSDKFSLYENKYKTAGNNLIDKAEALIDKYCSNDNEILPLSNTFVVYAFVKPNTLYYSSISIPASSISSLFLDKNFQKLGNRIENGSTSFTTPDFCYFIVFSISNLDNLDIFQLSTSPITLYEPFRNVKEIDFAINNTAITNSTTTEGLAVNSKIAELYLVGLDPSKSYKIIQCENRSDGYKIIRIADFNGNEVCRLLSPNPQLFGGKYYYIPPYNSSNIFGYVVMDTTTVYNITKNNIILNTKVVSNLSYSKTINDSLFLSKYVRDSVRKNICNPALLIHRKRHSFSTLYIGAADSTIFSSIQPIPLDKDEYVTISNAFQFQCNAYIVDKYNRLLQTIPSGVTGNVSVATYRNTTGVDGYIMLEYRTPSADDGNYPQIEYGQIATDYHFYRSVPVKANEVTIVLPKKNYFLKDNEYNLYRKNIVNCSDNKNYEINAVNNANTAMLTCDRQFRGTSPNVTTSTIDITVKDDRLVLAKATRDVIVLNKSTSGTINFLALGDSFTDIAEWLRELSLMCVSDGLNINTIGFKNVNPLCRNENQTGGTLRATFLQSRGAAYLLGVVALPNVTITDGFGSAVYRDTNGADYSFDGRKVNNVGNGIIRIFPINGSSIPPINSSLIKISGVGPTSIDYTTVETIDRNPFWNGSFDPQYYLQKYGYETEFSLTTSKFVIIIQFAWNDNADNYNKDNIDLVVSNYKTAIDKIHMQYPNAYVVVSIEPTSTLLAGTVNENRRTAIKWSRSEFAKSIFAEFETPSYNSFVYIVPSYAYVDLQNGFNSTTITLSNRYPSIVDTIGTDPTHCNNAGMQQIADAIRPVIHKIVS